MNVNERIFALCCQDPLLLYGRELLWSAVPFKKKEKQQHTNNHEGENSSTGLFIQNIQAYGIELKGNSKHSQFSLSEAMHILISRPLAKLFQSLDSDFTFSFQYEQSLSK